MDSDSTSSSSLQYPEEDGEDVLANLSDYLAEANDNFHQEDIYPPPPPPINSPFDIGAAYMNAILSHRDEDGMNLLEPSQPIFFQRRRT